MGVSTIGPSWPQTVILLISFTPLKKNFFDGTGAWTQGYTLSHSTIPFFSEGFFEIGSRELFGQAGFGPPDLCLLSS
jgi:hypothetical protein